jgi:hypothetical protein
MTPAWLVCCASSKITIRRSSLEKLSAGKHLLSRYLIDVSHAHPALADQRSILILYGELA